MPSGVAADGEVVLPGGGGFGASTIPEVDGVVEGDGIVSIGTELVVGKVDAVGEVLLGLPFTLFSGCGTLPGPDGVVFCPAVPPTKLCAGLSAGAVSFASSSTLVSRIGGVTSPVRGVSNSSTGTASMCAARRWASACSRLARAADAPSGRKKILVAVFQRGAVDGLNVVVPYQEKNYYSMRPSIAIKQNEVIDLDGFFGLRGWQWLFIIEGLPPIIMCFVTWKLLTDRPKDAAWLRPEQRTWLQARLEALKLEAGPENVMAWAPVYPVAVLP